MARWLVMLAAIGCSPAFVEPGSLTLKLLPSTLKSDGSLARVSVSATTATGDVGKGEVRLRTAAGLLDAAVLTLDGFGAAETTYRCDRGIDEGCAGAVTLSAEWVAPGLPAATATARVTLSTGTVAQSGCDFGTARSTATTSTLDLFGNTVFFNQGQPLPAGRYRLRYSDGCMKYASDQGWTIHAYADGRSAWWVVGQQSSQTIVMPPGTVGYSVSNGAFATFAECVAANRALPSKDFDFAGGVLGLWLKDMPYSDNLAGEGGRNPSWQLTTPTCP